LLKRSKISDRRAFSRFYQWAIQHAVLRKRFLNIGTLAKANSRERYGSGGL
jgi:hypothetical protein